MIINKIFIALLILISVSCRNNKHVEIIKITISSMQESDKPYPVIILSKNKLIGHEFPIKTFTIKETHLNKVSAFVIKNFTDNQSKKLLSIIIENESGTKEYLLNKNEGVLLLNETIKIMDKYN